MPQIRAPVNGGGAQFTKICTIAAEMPAASHRNADLCAKPSGRAFMKHDIAAMRTRNVAGNRKPKPRAAFIEIAGIIEAIEWFEYIFAAFRRNPRPVIVDGDGQLMIGLRGCQGYLAGVANRIVLNREQSDVAIDPKAISDRQVRRAATVIVWRRCRYRARRICGCAR